MRLYLRRPCPYLIEFIIVCSIQFDPENLTAINNLAGMGILTDDDDLIDAALSEILALPLDQRLARDPRRDVTYLLIQHHLGQVCTIFNLETASCSINLSLRS